MKHACIGPGTPLILASASPRRRRLLEQIGLPFEVLPSRVHEESELSDPQLLVQELAARKAREVFGRSHAGWTLGADTVVAIGEEILNKPSDIREAIRMLTLLSGREHRVITGISIVNPDGAVLQTQAVTTLVRFKRLSEREIADYTATGEPMGKAGAYAIQGIGAFLVEGIFGSYTNVVGLPVCALVNALFSLGALNRFPLTR